ncbi:hypothetical protein DSCW_51900 [Desulfosarcina widdelii]|uniref:Uncharacterized protein n=1 Tax=Desulfosarcina widdelii TaxID=947919 RepID=A0A5K7ZDI4_9BACT|nr:hypothetical protein DSCW_51900 [Desulfosarcina widdelii]
MQGWSIHRIDERVLPLEWVWLFLPLRTDGHDVVGGVRHHLTRAPQTALRRAIHGRCMIPGQFEIAALKTMKPRPPVKMLVPLDQGS